MPAFNLPPKYSNIGIAVYRALYPNVAENLWSKRFRLDQQGAFGHFQGRKRIKHTVRS
jgi:hypothetical protein